MTPKMERMTNAAHAVLVLTVLASVFVVLSVPASASVTVQIADANAQSDSTTTTQITIDGMTNFGAATVTLSYDSSVVQINGATAGDVGTPTANIDNTAGTATIAAYVNTVTGPDSPITFASIELLAVGDDGESSPLTLEVTTLADADGTSVPATAESGVFVVGSGGPPASVIIQIGDASVDSGCTTTTQITIDGMTNFGAATVTLSYDSSVVQINGATAGDVGTPTANIDNTAGTATIAAYVNTVTGPDSPITFASIELLAVGDDGESSPLTLEVTTLADADGTSVPATAESGVFVVGSGGPPASVIIQIGDASVDSGCTTTTQITIDGMTNFGAATVTLSYDSSVVQINGATAGDVGTPTANIDNTAGTATIAAYVNTVTGPDSPITFASIELLAVGDDGESSPLTLEVTTLADADGTSVPATAESGVFVVGSGGPPASVIIQIGDASVDSGCTTTTQITIDGMTNFGAATVTLSYDSSVVQINGATAGDVGTPTANIDNTAGTATIAAYVNTVTGPDSPITFASIELLAVGDDGESSPLTLEVTTLADADGTSVPATAESGVFVVGTVKGDLNRDGSVTSADAAIALEIAAGSHPCDAEMLAVADVSGDNRVTSLDALMILQAATGEITL